MNKLILLVYTVLMAGCTATTKEELTESGLKRSDFQTEVNGEKTDLFVLKNKNKMEVCVTNFGGRIVSVMVPDKDGNMKDVVLGFDSIQDYIKYPSDFGASIDSVAILQLFKVLIDISTDSGGLSEVHGSSFYCYYFAGCHEGTVYRSITIGIQCQQVIRVIRRRITIQVEVGMVGHVDDGRFIRFCFILYIDGIVICQFHDNGALQIAGESFFSVLCQISQLQFLVALLYPFVHTILETFRTAM